MRPFGRQAVLEGVDDVGVLELGGDLAFARLVEPFEARLESDRLPGIENLQPHHLARREVAGHVEARHRARNRLVQQRETFRDVQLAAGEDRLEVVEQGHEAVESGSSGVVESEELVTS